MSFALPVVVLVFLCGVAVGIAVRAIAATVSTRPVPVCGSRFRAEWYYPGQGTKYYTLVRCTEPRGHRGKHSAHIWPARSSYGRDDGPVAWTDEESLDGAEPLDVPDVFKKAMR